MVKAAACLFMMIASNIVTTYAEGSIAGGQGTSGYARSADWMRSSTGTWPGMKDGKTYWYKLDKKAGLWSSADGKQWSAVKGGQWADKDGKWIKIHEKKLVWSTDGKSWSEVPEWKWQGSDGKWYKFDTDWALWVNE